MDIASVLAFLANHALDIVGGASALAAVLRNLLPYLEKLADQTISDADNRFVENLGAALAAIAALLDAAKKAADAIGLNPKPTTAWSEPEDVTIEVDADKSSDGSL